MKRNYEKIIIVGDQHIPNQDEKTLKPFEKFLRKEMPDTLVINGDLLDFYDLSNFDKEITSEGLLQDELDAGYKLLKKYRTILPKAKIYLTSSNHMENRLRRFKKTLGRAVHSLRYFTVPQMLKLEELDIEPIDIVRYKNFLVMHGDLVRRHSAYTAKAMLETKGKSVFIGHTHRLGSHYKTDEGGEHVAVECGCMCTLDPEYMDNLPNWQQGFAIVYRDKTTDWFQHYLIPIIDNKFIWEGREYK